MITLEGTHRQIGYRYGQIFADKIEANLRILVYRTGQEPLPTHDADFNKWVQGQERLIENACPWLIEEMSGVAEGTGVDYKDILLLNLRPWQWEYYGKTSEQYRCSSLLINLSDGAVANAGVLDDSRKYYCGPVRFAPEGGHRFITFPITGTSWCMRTLNSAGLAIGISSQLLPGLHGHSSAMNQDLATRVIAETCSSVDDVRRFCQEHAFTLNLVCSDAQGNIFCAHQTSAEPYELAESAPFALTNHVVSDDLFCRLSRLGVTDFPYACRTRERRGNLLDFICEKDRRASAEEVRQFISTRDDLDPGSIRNSGTIAVTYANPQREPGVFWIAEPNENDPADWVQARV